MSHPADADFSGTIGFSYLTGVFVAVNGLPDAYLLVEGPDCVHMKTQYVQGNHDWLSTLTDVSGHHRVANTALHPAQMAGSREDHISRVLGRLAQHPAAGVVLITPMPMAALTGVDYDRLADEVVAEAGTPVFPIPGRSLAGDWLDGYAETLQTLARRLEPTGTPRAGAVAVVGNLFDREEEDSRGNVRELRRLIRALELDPVSIWLDGSPSPALRRVGEASVILSLPYGRRAARTLARRTGAQLVEAPLPFGIDATEEWLTLLADVTGRRAALGPLLDRERERFARRLEWVVPALLANRRIGFVGDPHLLSGLSELCWLLGLELRLPVVTNRARHARELARRVPGLAPLVAPTRKVFTDRLRAAIDAEELEVLIGNGFTLDFTGVEVMGLGFPNELTHALYDRPFLGYRGALAFVDSLANHLRRVDRTLWRGLQDLSGVVSRSPG